MIGHVHIGQSHIFVEEVSVQVFCPFFNCTICFLVIVETSPLPDTYFENIFFQSVACLFIFLHVSLDEQKFLILSYIYTWYITYISHITYIYICVYIYLTYLYLTWSISHHIYLTYIDIGISIYTYISVYRYILWLTLFGSCLGNLCQHNITRIFSYVFFQKFYFSS